MTDADRLADTLLRLARLTEAEGWSHGLNPTQAAALAYLARANRFSRGPSHLADWLGTTRGTVSQTLKALAERGLVIETASPRDRRSISYALLDAGRDALARPDTLASALADLPAGRAAALTDTLASLLGAVIARQKRRAFGLCRTCRHHRSVGDHAAHCTLLDAPLAAEEARQICAEHAA